MKFTPPMLLSDSHLVSSFRCGEDVLDNWLKRTALKNQQNKASRTFVICNDKNEVIGFYALSAGAVPHQLVSGAFRRNMPDPIPVVVLGRLAIDVSAQGMNVGASLLQDAVLKAQHVAEQIGVKALLVHALNDSARRFYLKFGFTESPIDNKILMLKL